MYSYAPSPNIYTGCRVIHFAKDLPRRLIPLFDTKNDRVIQPIRFNRDVDVASNNCMTMLYIVSIELSVQIKNEFEC